MDLLRQRIRELLPEPVLRAATALLGLGALTAIIYTCLHLFGRQHPILIAVLALFYFLLLLGCAWMGYVPGLLVCALSIWVVPHIIGTPSRRGQPDYVRFGLLAAVSLLISRIADENRQREADLRRAAAE